MSELDLHIHVDVRLHADVAVRDMLAATFGLASDIPSRVMTGCGRTVRYAMTSRRPESVTCLPCREYAHHENLRRAAKAESLSRTPGTAPDLIVRAVEAAKRYRDLAERFTGA